MYRKYMYYTSHVYLPFGHFNVILNAKLVWPDMTTNDLYVESLPTL